jgi:starvation-inducible DNA-binding protein
MATKSKASPPAYTVPSMSTADGARVAEILQQRLDSLNDLALTLKHVHWNVVGPQFIAVHEMIDPQVADVRAMVDEIAERIATLGVSPAGTVGGLVERRDWSDYAIGRADAIAHLGALDVVYQGIISEHRAAADETEKLDPVTNDMLIGHLHSLELFHWFVRAHLENAGGALATAGATSDTAGADKAGAVKVGARKARK